ncbi:MAG: serine--tRNA ligase, partial [Bacteroidota bacterium]
MLPLQYLRDFTEEAKQRLSKRNPAFADTVTRVLAIDEQARLARQEMENNQSEANKLAKQIGELMKSGRKEDAEHLKIQTAQLKTDAKGLEEKVNQLEDELFNTLVTLPNTPHGSVPQGKSADDNEVIYQSGETPVMPEGALPHWELITKYNLIDFELGTKITGAGFPVYRGKGARLQRGLVNFFLDEAMKAGYEEIVPPFLVNADSGFGTGQLPDKEGQMYYMPAEDFYMIPTAEVPLTNIYRDVILPGPDFSIKMCG